MTTKEELAEQIVKRIFRNEKLKRSTNISAYLDSKSEASYMAHVLNGPIADWVMKQPGNWRWVSVKATDLLGLKTAGELMDVCATNLV